MDFGQVLCALRRTLRAYATPEAVMVPWGRLHDLPSAPWEDGGVLVGWTSGGPPRAEEREMPRGPGLTFPSDLEQVLVQGFIEQLLLGPRDASSNPHDQHR